MTTRSITSYRGRSPKRPRAVGVPRLPRPSTLEKVSSSALGVPWEPRGVSCPAPQSRDEGFLPAGSAFLLRRCSKRAPGLWAVLCDLRVERNEVVTCRSISKQFTTTSCIRISCLFWRSTQAVSRRSGRVSPGKQLQFAAFYIGCACLR